MEFTFIANQYFWVSVCFITMLALMVFKVSPMLTKVLDERIEKIKTDIDGAEKARADSEKALADYNRQLQQAREEAAEIVTRARDEAQQLVEARTTELEADLKRKAEDAKRNIEAAREAALNDIKKEVAGMVVMVAEKVIDAEVDDKKAGKITDDAIKQLMN